MKICIVEQSTNVMGGVERVISSLANEFVKNDEVTIISEVRTSKKSFYKYDDKIKFINLCDNSFSESKNIFIKVIKKVRRKILMNIIHKKVANAFMESDVIIFGRVGVARRFKKYFEKYPIKAKVISRDDMNFKYLKDYEQRFVLNEFTKFVDYFLVLTEESRNYYLKMGFDESKTKIIRMINPMGLEPEKCYNLNAKTIFSFGRLCFQKNFENLILAFKYVHEIHPDWQLKIYGEGELKNKLNKMIKENNLSSCAYIMPSEKDVKNIFKNSSIYVMSSRYEGYANALVESLACGMPSISYDWIMGGRAAILDGVNGIIVDLKDREAYFKGIDCEEDIKKLANAINKLIENPDLCEKLSNEAMKIIDNRKIDDVIKKWYKLMK